MSLLGATHIPNLIIGLDTATLITIPHCFSCGVWILLQQPPKIQPCKDTSLKGKQHKLMLKPQTISNRVSDICLLSTAMLLSKLENKLQCLCEFTAAPRAPRDGLGVTGLCAQGCAKRRPDSSPWLSFNPVSSQNTPALSCWSLCSSLPVPL